MIVERFAQTLKTKIAIKNFDRRSEPETKKQLYKLIEEELAKFKEEEKKKDNEIKELKSKIKEAKEQVEKSKKLVFETWEKGE